MFRKLVMYFSAFLPMFSIMWTKEILLIFRNILEKPCEYSWSSIYSNPYLIGEIIVIFLVGLILYCLLKRDQRISVYTITLKSVKNRSAEYYLSYYSLFILALIGFSLTDPIDLIILLLLLIVLGIVYIKNNLFFMNPTVNIFQSYIYEIEYETGQTNTIISKLIISPVKLYEGNIIDIDVSEFEFTFFRRSHEGRSQNAD